MIAYGNRIIVKPDEVETVSEGGIITMTDAQVEGYRDQTDIGTVHMMGPACFIDPIMGSPDFWCKEGDRVYYAKHAGKEIIDPETDIKYVVMNDDAIQVGL